MRTLEHLFQFTEILLIRIYLIIENRRRPLINIPNSAIFNTKIGIHPDIFFFICPNVDGIENIQITYKRVIF